MEELDVRVLDHPAASLTLAQLRDETTDQQTFRRCAERLGGMLAIAAMEQVPTTPFTVRTPLGPAGAVRPSLPIVAVPVLRAGLGLLPGVLDAAPDVRVGMIGLERDDDTLEAAQYYRKVPPLAGAWIFLLEPMLATGGSASAAAQALHAEGAEGITVLAVVGTEQGLRRIKADNPTVRFVVGGVDPELDDNGYIVPGLGDFGDRLFGTTE